MKKLKPKRKPKAGESVDAPASSEKGARARKEVFELEDAPSVHELMDLNGPRVAKWAFQCVQKAARGRASVFEQKIALLMIQKSTPSTARKGEEDPDTLPEGATKDEIRALNRLIEDEKARITPATQPKEGARPAPTREDTAYRVVESGPDA
jgi:hypothetical protein